MQTRITPLTSNTPNGQTRKRRHSDENEFSCGSMVNYCPSLSMPYHQLDVTETSMLSSPGSQLRRDYNPISDCVDQYPLYSNDVSNFYRICIDK